MLGTKPAGGGAPDLRPPSTPEEARALLDRLARRGRRNKYNVAPPAERTVDGILFSSKLEARRYSELATLRNYGHLRPPYFLRQVPFHLPGRTRYVCDFVVFWTDGRVTFEDAKGRATEVYKLKRRQVRELYQVEIEEVRRPARRRG